MEVLRENKHKFYILANLNLIFVHTELEFLIEAKMKM